MRIDATDRKVGMTLDELRGAVELAERINMPGDAEVEVRVTFKGRLQHIVIRRP